MAFWCAAAAIVGLVSLYFILRTALYTHLTAEMEKAGTSYWGINWLLNTLFRAARGAHRDCRNHHHYYFYYYYRYGPNAPFLSHASGARFPWLIFMIHRFGPPVRRSIRWNNGMINGMIQPSTNGRQRAIGKTAALGHKELLQWRFHFSRGSCTIRSHCGAFFLLWTILGLFLWLWLDSCAFGKCKESDRTPDGGGGCQGKWSNGELRGTVSHEQCRELSTQTVFEKAAVCSVRY